MLLLLLAGCASQEVAPSSAFAWTRSERPTVITVAAVESPLAPAFCSAMLGRPSVACAIRMTNASRCVIVTRPDDGKAHEHEAGRHCMGWDHP